MTDRNVSGKPIAVVLAVVLIGAALFKWWPSDERAIRRQLDALADLLTQPSTDTVIARAGRIAELRGYLAPEAHVRVSDQDLGSRDVLLATLERSTPPQGGVFVEFLDATMTFPEGGLADVHVTARATTNAPLPGDTRRSATVDVYDVTVGFAKREGDWVITKADARPRP